MPAFAPVQLAEPLEDRGSQTFLRHYSLCPRSGFLYAKYRGEASTAAMHRGTAFHTVVDRATRELVRRREPTIPPELVKVIVNEVLAEIPVPLEEHDYLRECCYRWASEFALDPRTRVVACETLFVLQLDGFEVRARVDFAQLLGGVCHLADYKTARGAPSMEDVARKRPDGTLAAKNFQLVLYALVVAFGRPVKIVDGAEIPARASDAARARRFEMEFIFPGIEDRDGRMLRRSMSLSRPELDEYRESLRGLIARLRASEKTGDWPAVVSDEACSICPSPQECPIPRELRDHRGEIQSVEQAAEAAMVLDRITAEASAVRKEIKAWCKANDVALRFGNRVWEFVPKSSERIRDRDAMFAEIEQTGVPFDRARHVTVVSGVDFRARDLTEAEKSEGSNE